MKKTVLIVDDEPANILVLRQILKDEYRIVAATSPQQALERANAIPQPSIILMDLNMPDTNGIELTRQLHLSHATKTIPVLLVTSATETELQQAFKVGVKDVIEKPVMPTLVRQRVRNYLL